jgi:hypothetical protein
MNSLEEDLGGRNFLGSVYVIINCNANLLSKSENYDIVSIMLRPSINSCVYAVHRPKPHKVLQLDASFP